MNPAYLVISAIVVTCGLVAIGGALCCIAEAIGKLADAIREEVRK